MFGKVPISLLMDKRITFNDLRVFIALSSFQGRNKDCFSSLKKISERSGVFVSRVSRHTNRLQSFGWLKITRRGKKKSNCYIVKSDSPLSDISQKDVKSDSPLSDVSDSSESDNSILKEHLKEHLKEEDKKNGSLLTFAQKYYSSINQPAFKKESSKGVVGGVQKKQEEVTI